jgi:MFS family permease
LFAGTHFVADFVASRATADLVAMALEMDDGASSPTHPDDACSPLLEASDASSLPEPLFRKIAMHVIPLLWLAYILNVIDRTNLAYAQLQMSTDLGLSAKAYGMASGIFFIAYATMQVPANHLIPRFGATRVLPASMALWGVSATATAFVTSEQQLIILRVCLGLAESAFFPGVLLYLTRWFPDSCSGRALAYFASAASVGGLLSSAGSGLLLSAFDGQLGVRGWRWLLALEGIPTVALGLLAPCFLVESPGEARWLSASERRILAAALHNRKAAQSPAAVPCDDESAAGGRPVNASAASQQQRPSPSGDGLTPAAAKAAATPTMASPGGGMASSAASSAATSAGASAAARPDSSSLLQSVRSALVQTPCLVFCMQYFVSAMIANSARFFLPTLLKEVFPTMPPWKLGMIFALPAALKVVLSPPVGAWADVGGAPLRFRTAWGLYGSAALLLLIAGGGLSASGDLSPRASSVSITIVALADVLCQVAIPVFWALHNSQQLPDGLKGCSIALVNSVGNLGGFAGPFVLGFMHDASPADQICTWALRPPKRGCMAQWGGGLLVLGASALVGSILSAVALRRRLPLVTMPPMSKGRDRPDAD